MRRLALWFLIVLAAAVAIGTVAFPTLYIQPFKPQRPDMLARAYALRQAAPAVTAMCLPIVVLSALALVWGGTLRTTRRAEVPRHAARGAEALRHMEMSGVGQDFSPAKRDPIPARQRNRRFLRIGLAVARGLALVALVGLTSLVTWFSRQNHFEWMFAQPAEVKYVSAADASKFLTPDEMVMGIEVGGLSLAYPVRQMAYHHIVNDMLGTTPVVVTY